MIILVFLTASNTWNTNEAVLDKPNLFMQCLKFCPIFWKPAQGFGVKHWDLLSTDTFFFWISIKFAYEGKYLAEDEKKISTCEAATRQIVV